MGHGLPEDLVPGKRPANGPSYPMDVGSYDDNFEGNSPTDTRAPDMQFSRLGLEGEPSNGGGYGGGFQSPDGRVGRQQELGPGPPRDRSVPRNHSRPGGGSGAKSPSNTPRVCKKCDESLTGQFVRALGGTFHLECFKCMVSIFGWNGTRKETFLLTFFSRIGLRSDCRIEIFPGRPRGWKWSIPVVRN